MFAIPMVVLYLSNGHTHTCTQKEADFWAQNKFLARTIIRAEYL